MDDKRIHRLGDYLNFCQEAMSNEGEEETVNYFLFILTAAIFAQEDRGQLTSEEFYQDYFDTMGDDELSLDNILTNEKFLEDLKKIRMDIDPNEIKGKGINVFSKIFDETMKVLGDARDAGFIDASYVATHRANLHVILVVQSHKLRPWATNAKIWEDIKDHIH